MDNSEKNNVSIEEGDIFEGIDASSFTSDVKRKMDGRKVLITRAFRRQGAHERSFDCVFLATKKGSKDYKHTFLEQEKQLTKILLAKCEKPSA